MDLAPNALLSLLPPSIVVGAHGRVIHAHGDLSPFLRNEGATLEDGELETLVSDALTSVLRQAIEECARTEARATRVVESGDGLPTTRIVVEPASELGVGAVVVGFHADEDPRVEELQRGYDEVTNFLASTGFAAVFLDDDHNVVRFTPAAADLLELSDEHVGRSIPTEDVLLQHDLNAAVRAVLSSLTPSTLEISTPDGRTFVRRVLPFHTHERRIEGAVVSFVDITELKEATESLRVRESQQAAIAGLGRRSLYSLDHANFTELVACELRNLLSADFCRVREFDPVSEKLVVVSEIGFEHGAEPMQVSLETPAGFALHRAEPVLMNDVESDRRFAEKNDLLEEGVCSGILCPIEDGKRSYGLVEVYARQPRDFTTGDADFVRAAATVIAHSVNRLRQRRRLAIEDAVAGVLASASTFDEAVDGVFAALAREVTIDHFQVWIADEEPGWLRRSHSFFEGGTSPDPSTSSAGVRISQRDGVVGAVWTRASAQWVPAVVDESELVKPEVARELGLRSGFVFPVATEEEVRAVLVVLSSDQLVGDPSFVEQLDRIGQSVGQFCVRADAELRLRGLAAIVEHSDDAILSKRLDGTITSWNYGAQALYGWTDREMIGKPIDVLVPEDRRAGLATIMALIGRGERVEPHDTERLHRDGHRVHVSLTVSPIVDTRGVVVGASAVSRDITERKRTEEALRNSERRLLDAFRSVPFPIFILNENGEMLLASDRAFELSGFGRHEAARLRTALNPVFGARAAETFARIQELARRRGPSHDGAFRIAIADGQLRVWDFHSAAIGSTAGGSPLTVTVAQDVTEQREAEERLRDSEWRFRQVLVNAPIPMMVHDENGNVLEISKSWKNVFGYGLDEHPTIDAFAFSVFEERAGDVLDFIKQMAARESAAEDVELEIRTRAGQQKFLLFNAAPLGRLPDGRRVRVVAAVDITNQKGAEERLRAADRQKDQFLAMLGHELRNPLAAIRSASEVLNLVEHEDRRLEKSRAILGRQTTHMAKLLDGLLDATRIAQGKIELELELHDLDSVLSDLVDDYRSRALNDAARITAVIAHGLTIRGDSVRLRQVFDNLLANAIKFTPSGEIGIRAFEEDGEVIVTVSDSGAGIDPELLPYIFEPFRQATQNIDRADGGLGLGLALVKGLVELHDGTIEVESRGAGQGTVVTVRLPAEHAGVVELVAAGDPPRDGWRFGLIEDNVDLADALGDLLEASGHEVTLAHDGHRGIELVEQQRPDIVLCDIGLPGEVSGYEVARSLRKRPELAHIVLVALTGYGRAEDKREAHEAGFDFHLTKPVDLDAIETILQQMDSDAPS